ncbi:MAG: pectinesterase family protein, partial [Lacrimispora sp.]
APRINGRQLYKNCYQEGDIDFIFGSATAYFESCTFFSKYTGKEISSYVTAASTPQGQEYGYVMENCRFESNCPPDSAYLGRPWREYAKTVLINCYIDDHICKEGWHDWNKDAAHEHAFYGEYGSYGPGAAMERRPDWVRKLAEEDLQNYTKEAVLQGQDGWRPE